MNTGPTSVLAVTLLLLTVSCAKVSRQTEGAETNDRKDYHTFSNPEQIQVKNVDLDLDVNFERKVLSGTATLTVDRAASYPEGPVVLDTRTLDITRAEASVDLSKWADCKWEMGKTDAILGTPLTVHLPAPAKFVRIHYSTRPEASGLQWLTPAQTAGKTSPYMFSQSEAIHARSWVPLQDSPFVRITYSARVRTPKPLVAVMSAENDPTAPRAGEYTMRMPNAIPTYLMAIAAGDIYFRGMSKRTGVYSEKGVVDEAAKEFEDTESMLQAAEVLFGPYRWGRYDILVLPPSFPFGGMENPRLTFATPTLLAGDKSLVETIAHELAHSWSGNLVTNATWRDFWLNEGFTDYCTLRIIERVYGPDRADMEAVLERQQLEDVEFKRLPPRDQVLHIDLKGRDPDDGMTEVPYIKGMLFLRSLEEAFGRDRFDPFLRSYFDRFAFRSITTADFVSFLKSNLFPLDPEVAKTIPVDEWINKPGLPASAPRPASRAFKKIDEISAKWQSGALTSPLPGKQWSTHEWLHFLRSLPDELGTARMSELDREFNLTKSGNAEITSQWLLMSIRNHYEPAYPRLEQFLTSVGRRKYLRPLYEELAKTPEGKQRAKSIYAKARTGYHPIAAATVDQIVK